MGEFAAGEKVLATKLNGHGGVMVAMIYRNAAKALSAATDTYIDFDTVLLDTQDVWDIGTPTRYTPNKAGWYVVWGGVGYGAAGATSDIRRAALHKNGSAISPGGFMQQAAGQTSASQQVQSPKVAVEMNGTTDYFELQARSSNAVSTTTGSSAPFLCVEYHGDLT